MFHPIDQPMERGWVGRIEGEHVFHLAAQTLQAFFTGGGSAREHAVYPLDGVRLLAPVLHPPAVRVFDAQTAFEFRNPAAIVGPDRAIQGEGDLWVSVRLAAVLGAEGQIAGYTLAADWRLDGGPPPKDRDFAFGLGPAVVTPDEFDPDPCVVDVRLEGDAPRGETGSRALSRFDWPAARDFAAEGTQLLPGDVIAGPMGPRVVGLQGPAAVEFDVEGIGALRQRVDADG
jgi:Fumarylacetoacetate (FAA) hydrolase family